MNKSGWVSSRARFKGREWLKSDKARLTRSAAMVDQLLGGRMVYRSRNEDGVGRSPKGEIEGCSCVSSPHVTTVFSPGLELALLES